MKVSEAKTFHWVALYIASHVLFEWFGQHFADRALSVASWHPAAGLGFVAICVFGVRFVPVVMFATTLASVLLRADGEPIVLAAIDGSATGAVYSVAALALRRDSVHFDVRLQMVRDLMLLLSAAVISSAAASIINALEIVWLGLVAPRDLARPMLRYWIGDMLGIAIIAPLGMLALQARLTIRLSRLAVLQIVTTVLLFGLAVALREGGRFQYFYFLFLPVIWVALSAGLEGAVTSLALIQSGMFIAVAMLQIGFVDVADFQARMVALAGTGLIAGALVTERQVTEERLRAQQLALAQVETRGSLVELGTAIAHEVNQPLSAAGTYATLVVESLAKEQVRDATILDHARKVERQIHRASSVVRNLRALVRLARNEQAPTPPQVIISEVMDLVRHEPVAAGITLRADVDAGLPAILGDKLQLEQAMINLTRNALEAIQSTGAQNGTVTIYAREVAAGAIELGVVDNGPGFSHGFSLDRLQPFKSEKQDGLGVGLSLCLSVARANGGELVVHASDVGAHVGMIFGLERKVDV